MLPANPGSVVFAGRLFDFHVLDMIELGIEKFASLSDIKVKRPHGPSQTLQLSVVLQVLLFQPSAKRAGGG